MKFSIIVAIYNVQKYIEQCIDSVLMQDFKNIELILVDDGSTDGCSKICDEYAQKDQRVVVIHKKNGGSSDARNVGIQRATGDYIIFLDGDDFWLKSNFLSNLNTRIEKYNADVISLNYLKVFNNGKTIRYFSTKSNMSQSYFGEKSIQYIIDKHLWIASAWNKVIKRSLFLNGDLLFKKGITSEDIDWCARLAILAKSFDYLDTPYIGYRQTENSISRTITYNKVCCLYYNIVTTKKITDDIDGDKNQLLMLYLAYQFYTLLINIAFLKSFSDRRGLCEKIMSLKTLLNYSQHRNIKLVGFAINCLGMHTFVEVIHFIINYKIKIKELI